MEWAAIGPDFSADTLLLALFELALVTEVIDVIRDALAVISVIGPLSLICLTFDVSEFAEACGVTKIPVSFIGSAVTELHDTVTMSEAA